MAGTRSQEHRIGSGNGHATCASELGQPPGERINQFSLVSYIPGRLGRFLTDLRRELVPDCVAEAHVTVLPPRPLELSPAEAGEELRERLTHYEPFELVMPRLAVFEESNVIFAEVAAGRDELLRMHSELNTGSLGFDEPWEYHPHVTLAQGLTAEVLPERYEAALRRWDESNSPTRFVVETLAFVQNTTENRWVDLVEYDLGRAVTLTPGGRIR